MPRNNALNIDGEHIIENLSAQIESLRAILTHLDQLPNSALINIQKRYVQTLIRRAQNKILEVRRNLQ